MLQPPMYVTYCVLKEIYRHNWQILPVFSSFKRFASDRSLHTTIRPMAIRLFEGETHAKLYAQYRPTYPNAIYEEIVKFCTSEEDKLPLDLAVDIGCGSGQSTRPLCQYFRHVIGSDVSEEQIKSAISENGDANDKIRFHTGPGEDLSFLKDNSVDLITIAQALHWLNLDRFYAEVKRVLKPKGVFAAYGYGLNLLDNPEAEHFQREFYNDFLHGYWNEERRHIENHFVNLRFPFEPTTRIESDSISIRRRMPLSAYIGYISTWSAWVKHKKLHPESDELENLHKKMHEVYSTISDQEDPVINVYWPGFLIMCRKPA